MAEEMNTKEDGASDVRMTPEMEGWACTGECRMVEAYATMRWEMGECSNGHPQENDEDILRGRSAVEAEVTARRAAQ